MRIIVLSMIKKLSYATTDGQKVTSANCLIININKFSLSNYYINKIITKHKSNNQLEIFER